MPPTNLSSRLPARTGAPPLPGHRTDGDRLRIALLAEDYYPQLGGVPEHVHHLALELRRLGHEATIVTSRMAPRHQDPEFVHRVGRSVVLYANGGVARITVGWQLTRRLAAWFRHGRFDLVHVHGGLAPTFGLVGPRAAWRVGIPVVATFHSWFPRSVGYRLWRRPLQAMLDRHSATIVVSRAAAAAMARYFQADWQLIPNGIDLERFRPGRAGEGPGGGQHPGEGSSGGAQPATLLFLGRLEPRNGLDTVLAALPSVLAAYPETRLVVAGDGPWRARYERLARPLGDRVQFLGAVFAERPALYRSAAIYLCPTRRASFGVTLLEALASATAVIASDLPAFRDVLGPVPAPLIPATDPDAWAAAIGELLAAPERRRQLGRLGRKRAADFAWPRIARQIEGVYRRVLARQARTAA